MPSATSRRRLRLAAGLLGTSMALTGAGTALAATGPTVVQGPAAALLADTNASRAGSGLAALSSASDLVAVATEQSLAMAAHGYLYHNPDLTSEVGNWQALGENVGTGASAAAIAQAFMDSTEHRDNILSSLYRQVGIGVVSYNGMLWVTEDFREPVSATPRVVATTSVPSPSSSSVPVVTRPASVSAPSPVIAHAPAATPARSSGPAASTAAASPTATPARTPPAASSVTADPGAGAATTGSPGGSAPSAGSSLGRALGLDLVSGDPESPSELPPGSLLRTPGESTPLGRDQGGLPAGPAAAAAVLLAAVLVVALRPRGWHSLAFLLR